MTCCKLTYLNTHATQKKFTLSFLKGNKKFNWTEKWYFIYRKFRIGYESFQSLILWKLNVESGILESQESKIELIVLKYLLNLEFRKSSVSDYQIFEMSLLFKLNSFLTKETILGFSESYSNEILLKIESGLSRECDMSLLFSESLNWSKYLIKTVRPITQIYFWFHAIIWDQK